MSQLDYLHLCEAAFLTEGTKNLNLISIFDNINVVAFPAIHPKFSIALGLSGLPSSSHVLVVKLLDPQNSEIGKFTNKFTLEPGKDKNRAILSFVNFPLPSEGTYEISVTLNDEKLGSRFFSVIKINA
ncbi:MAG TPA: hypothetical protein VLE93_01545 [Candidatus Saccharimonadales bacterium]|nr:hypothetical protein [Candidatus Saccharimonadales bacterium]